MAGFLGNKLFAYSGSCSEFFVTRSCTEETRRCTEFFRNGISAVAGSIITPAFSKIKKRE